VYQSQLAYQAAAYQHGSIGIAYRVAPHQPASAWRKQRKPA